MNNEPEFSIIVPTFNSVSMVGENIKSILSQSITNLEVIIVDNRSTDGTLELLNSLSDQRVNIICENDLGIYDAMNKGIAAARGKYLHVLNSDDRYSHDNVLSNILFLFNSNEKTNLIYSGIKYFSRKTGRYSSEWLPSCYSPKKLKLGWHPPHPGIFAKKSIFENIGAFDLSFGVTSDLEWLIRVFKHELTIPLRLDEVTVDMRQGGASDASLRVKYRGLKTVYRIHRKAFGSSKLASTAVIFRILSKSFFKLRGRLKYV